VSTCTQRRRHQPRPRFVVNTGNSLVISMHLREGHLLGQDSAHPAARRGERRRRWIPPPHHQRSRCITCRLRTSATGSASTPAGRAGGQPVTGQAGKPWRADLWDWRDSMTMHAKCARVVGASKSYAQLQGMLCRPVLPSHRSGANAS